MFNNEDPVLTLEHLLPTGDMPSQSPRSFESYSDAEALGMESMLIEAGAPGTQNSRQLFLQGMTDDGIYIQLDLEKDEMPLSPHEITCSIDIDSIIWVTHHVKIKTQLMIHVLPHLGRHPPISKNNHVYVELLMPCSERDQQENGTRTEWFTLHTSLSTIPHSHFAKVSLNNHCKISVHLQVQRSVKAMGPLIPMCFGLG
jgi:hypothetical protein